jgi:hypothetical protein
MHRTTVFLDEGLRREVQALARRQARPAAAIVREAIERLIEAERSHTREAPGFVGIGRSGRSDIAETHEDLLFRGLTTRENPARPARGSSRRQRRKPRR